MKITDETIDYVAALSKIELTTEEKDKAKNDLGKILSHIESMNQLDTDNINPMSHVFDLKNVFREDIITNTNNREELLSNAPAKKDGCFMVPKTVE
jgi:aspartyl-tRNA(Asn)/glutamyl-tRNA(Gln) amidotransferase subunit C